MSFEILIFVVDNLTNHFLGHGDITNSAILKKKRYLEFGKNAKEFSKQFDWNKIIKNMSSSRVHRAISKFDSSASVNRNLRQNKKRAITMGYDADLAGSPTKMNPLSVDHPINEESVDADFD